MGVSSLFFKIYNCERGEFGLHNSKFENICSKNDFIYDVFGTYIFEQRVM